MDNIKHAHYNLGIAYSNDAQYNKAIPEFQTAIKLDANFIDAHCGLGRAYVEQDELDNAEMSVTAALKLDANYPPALALRDTIRQAYYDKGITSLNDEHYNAAVTTFQKVVTLDPDFKYAHYYLGRAYIGLQAYDKAVDSLQSAVALDANLEYAQYNLGYAYAAQGQYAQAVPHLEQAIAVDPNLKHAHYNLARAYRELDNLEAATNAATETLRLDANYQPAHELLEGIKQVYYNRGIAYLNDERYSEAVTAFQNAITLDSDFATGHYNLGLAYFRMEMYPRAVSSLEKTIALEPNHKAAYHALALAYFGQQELEKARNAASDALKRDANYQPARSLLEAIDPSFTPPATQATTPPDTGTTTNPQPNPQPDAKSRQEAHYELGTAYRESKMNAEAIAEFQKAIDIDPDFVAAYTSLGALYLEMWQIDEAENAAKEALRVDANSHPARQLLDDIRQVRPVRPTRSATKSAKQASTPAPAKRASAPADPSDTPDVKQDQERGLVFLNNKQYHQAAAAFKRVIKADASAVEAHYGLGQAYLGIGAFDDAKAAADEALRLNASHQQARELLQLIKFARNMERNRKIRKKVLFYAAILGVIAVGVFVEIKFEIIPRPNPPLNLSIAEAVLEEPSGNRFLDAGETARLKLIIRNNGKTVRNIEVRLQPPAIAGVKFKNFAEIGKLRQNREEIIRISMTADQKVKAKKSELQIQLFGKTGLFGRMEPVATKVFKLTIIPDIP